jgi:hypothetical protein
MLLLLLLDDMDLYFSKHHGAQCVSLSVCTHFSRNVLQSSPAAKGWSMASCIVRYRADAA